MQLYYRELQYNFCKKKDPWNNIFYFCCDQNFHDNIHSSIHVFWLQGIFSESDSLFLFFFNHLTTIFVPHNHFWGFTRWILNGFSNFCSWFKIITITTTFIKRDFTAFPSFLVYNFLMSYLCWSLNILFAREILVKETPTSSGNQGGKDEEQTK